MLAGSTVPVVWAADAGYSVYGSVAPLSASAVPPVTTVFSIATLPLSPVSVW